MLCGSPLGELLYLADRLLDGSQRRAGRLLEADGPPLSSAPVARLSLQTGGFGADALRAELYQMYGEGGIGEAVFAALRPLAERGQLRPADLAVHRARARRRPRGADDAPVAMALSGIRSRLAQLAEARTGSEQVLAGLEARLAGLDERMIRKEQAARAALAVGQDEQTARSRLAEKAEFASSRDRLTAQVQALRADVDLLDDLRLQLETKTAELEAVRARKRLAEEVLK